MENKNNISMDFKKDTELIQQSGDKTVYATDIKFIVFIFLTILMGLTIYSII
ncbi:hypothetical protein [Urechidicola vernalis]|uniref:Uncharacterized protein n=1 Tax=Urechidicola vernalis TaxID=3075600 RepID=A0ABU2Y0W4_9FLAO|nr:hypothetical protein [Urechidicola sp. P050]MDT0551826.1 hypothetical protein [Urechidicola sp. P050]